MKTRNNPWLRRSLLAASLVFTLSQASHAQNVWNGSVDSVLSNGNNYSPAIGTITSSGLNIQFNGTDTTTTDLTLATAMGGGTGTGGSSIAVLAGQTNALTITGTPGSIRLNTTGFSVVSGAAAVTFAGTGGFTIGGATGNSTHTISNDSANLLDLGVWSFGPGGGGTRTVSIGGAGNIQSNGNWSGATLLNKTGAGTLTLGGSTARTGTTTITTGVLKLTNALALQSSPLVTSGAGTMTLDGITTLTLGGLSGSANLSSVITTGYGGITELALNPGSGTQTYSGTITNGAAGMNLVKSGDGTQVLSGASSYTGTTSVTGGTLRLSGTLGASAVSIAATAGIAGEGSISTGGSLTLADGSTLTGNGNSASALSVGGNLTFDATTNVILEAAPATAGAATPIRLLDYTGTLAGSTTNFVLQNAANYRGHSFSTTTIGQVNMTLDTKSIIWSGASADWDVATSLNWDLGAEKFYLGDAVTFNDSGTTKAVTLGVSVMPASVTFNNSTGNDYSLTGAGAIAASAALTKSNTGTLTLSTPNTYSGGTTISVNGGKITATVANALGTGAVTNNAILDLTAGAVTYTGLSSSMSGNGTANVTLGTGSASTTLNGDYSTFTGTWNLGIGATAGAGKAAMGGLDNAASVVNVLAHATLYVNAATKNASAVLNGGDTGETQGQLRLDNGTVWNGGITLAGPISGTGDSHIGSFTGGGTVSGNIGETGGSQALVKGGPSTIALSGSNSYTGATTVVNGTLKLGSTGALGSATVKTSGVTVNSTAVFDLGGISPTAVVPLTLNSTANGSDVGSLNNSALGTTATFGGAITFQAATVMVGGGFTSPGGSITLNGAITGNGKNLNKNGLGTLALSNSGTVTLGTLQANRGVIQVDSGTQLNVTSLDIGTGGSVGGHLILNGGNVTSSGLSRFGQGTGSASGTLTLNSGTLTVPALTKGSLTFNANFNGGTLKASAATTTFFSAATSAKVQAAGAFIDDGGFAITIAQPLIHDSTLGTTPDGGLTKSGSGTLILSGANTYNGNTTVSAGTLELAANTGSLTFAPGANTVSNRVTGAGTATFKGIFNIDLTNAAVADNSSWVLADVSSKSFDSTTFSVAGFTEAPEGTWKLVDGANTWTFTQSDATLRLDLPSAAGYANWLALHPTITDPAPGADPEYDGIDNVLEYVFNGDPMASDPAILPDLDASGTNFVFTFTRREESPTDTTQIFQYGTNLSVWTDVAITGTPGPEVALGTPSGGLQTVTVTIPKSSAGPGGKLFGRLQAVKLP